MKRLARTLPLFLLPVLAQAQTLDVRPGLWEHKMQLKSESGRLEQMLEMVRTQLAALPQAQREMVENMMAQQGVRVDLANQSFQNCLTEEEARTGIFKLAENGDCQQTDISQEGGATRVSYSCDQGQGELLFSSDTEYTGTMNMTMELDGNPEKVTGSYNGQWIGGSCDALQQ